MPAIPAIDLTSFVQFAGLVFAHAPRDRVRGLDVVCSEYPPHGGMGGGILALPDFDREEFAEGKRLSADYLAQIARATGGKRQELIVEWAEKLYDARVQRRIGLVKSWGNLSHLRTELYLYQSAVVIPLLASAHLDDFEIEAIRLALEGRESDWLADVVPHLPSEGAAAENSSTDTTAAPDVVKDPIAVQREAWVDVYIAEVLRVKKKCITRTDFWKTAGYREATAFERWQRNDPRTSKRADRAFRRILAEKPHLK